MFPANPFGIDLGFIVFHNCDDRLNVSNPLNIWVVTGDALPADFRSPAVRRNKELPPLLQVNIKLTPRNHCKEMSLQPSGLMLHSRHFAAKCLTGKELER